MKKTTILETIIFLYAILFLYTGINKLIEYSIFREQLSESPILKPFAHFVALTLPWTEFLIVLMLLIPRWRLKGLYAALIMMTAFTIYIIALLSIDDKLPCSCGGIIAVLSWSQHIIFNSTFILLAIVGIVLQKQVRRNNMQAWEPLTKNKGNIIPQKI